MSDLRLNDIWRKVNTEISFYTSETFDKVPHIAGVYAWFYPLRILTKDLDDFIEDVSTALNYDSTVKGKPYREFMTEINWESYLHKIEINPSKNKLDNFKSIWNTFTKDDSKFDELRKVIMRSSIFLPPLYVGKAVDLNIRCFQHINGRNKTNSFHTRFEDYAKTNELKVKKISDLLFVALRTEDDKTINSDDAESLVEAILKQLAKPKYSER
jgi:hypothetical protein